MKFQLNSTLKELEEDFRVEFCSLGPTDKGWEGHYLECHELIQKSGCHGCKCGNLFIDDGMFRIAVENGQEYLVKTFFVYKNKYLKTPIMSN